MDKENKPDFEKLYFTLAGRVADAIDLLIDVMRECEALYAQGPENHILPIVPPSSHKES